MSLARTALRLACMEALVPFAVFAEESPVWPTSAGACVYDSRIGPAGLADIVPGAPLIVVSVDGAKTEPYVSRSDAAYQGRETVTLAFEIMVPARVGDSENAELQLAGPSDPLAKAMLELIEDQVQQRLHEARMSGPLRHVLVMVDEIEVAPYSDPDTDEPLSAVRLELKCQIRQRGIWPEGQTGLDMLPEPLRSVAQSLPAGSYGATIAAALASVIGSPASFPALAEIRLAANLARGAEDAPPPAADASATPPVGDIGGRIIFPT